MPRTYELRVDAETWYALDGEEVKRNPRRKRIKPDVFDTYGGLQVKLALVRAPDHDPKFKHMLGGPAEVFEFVQQLGVEPVEVFLVLLVNARNRVLGVYEAARGGLQAVYLTPRDVFAPALVANARAVLLVHNHPSGDPDFSKDDRALTARVQEAGKILGIELLDHLVVAGDSYVSMAEIGW